MRRPLLHLPSSVALVAAFLWLASPGGAGAQEPGASTPQAPSPPPAGAEPQVPPGSPPVEPEPGPGPQPKPDEVFSGNPVPETARERAEEHSWFDAGHAFVGRLFFSPVVKLDRFFFDETDLDPERAQSFARLRGGLKLRQDGKPAWSADLAGQLYLPGLQERLDRFRLVLSSTSGTGENTLTSDTGTGTPLARRQFDPANLELRFGAYRGIRSTIDLGAGILFHLPPGAFTRVRYRLAVPIDDVMVARFSSQVFWRTDLHLGTRITSALEWPATPSSMVRLSGASQVAQQHTNGIEYGTELTYSHAFTPTAAAAVGAGAVGASRSPVAFDKYRIFTRFRHDVLRRWLFFEVEPEVGWPWTEDRGRYRALAVTFRLELQFEGKAAAMERPQ